MLQNGQECKHVHVPSQLKQKQLSEKLINIPQIFIFASHKTLKNGFYNIYIRKPSRGRKSK